MNGAPHLPGLLGIKLEHVSAERVLASVEIRDELLAPTGYLHAATLVAVADSACGYGTLAGLDGPTGFTTIELKANFISTATEGLLECSAERRHGGATTQVWDAEVRCGEQALALFRCTQLILDRGRNPRRDRD